MYKGKGRDRGKLRMGEEQKEANEPGRKRETMETNETMSDLVQGLNALGVKPQDLTAILKAIQQAGALQAVIESR